MVDDLKIMLTSICMKYFKKELRVVVFLMILTD